MESDSVVHGAFKVKGGRLLHARFSDQDAGRESDAADKEEELEEDGPASGKVSSHSDLDYGEDYEVPSLSQKARKAPRL